MSVDQNIYVGPYMIVKNRTETSSKITNICNNDKCKRYNEELYSNFCPSCGNKRSEKSVPIIKTVTATDVLSNIDNWDHEIFAPHGGGYDMFKDKEVIISNFHAPSNIKIDEDRANEYSLYPNTPKINEYIEWFKNEHKNFLDPLKNYFGEDNCEMKWGIIIYFS